MAITQTYCAFATGNDYKGASFTDGAFTVADMTLTKAGAFAASKVNHWLYLTDNGSGQVTAGYYKIATVTSDNAVVLATSPKSGATDPTDVVCTQAAGTTALPWRSVQGALDLITRDTTNGDQVNVKAGTADTLSASLTYATYGTPTYSAPLIIRGYTATLNDGGMGKLDGNGGAYNLLHTTWVYTAFIDMELCNVGAYYLATLGNGSVCLRCKIHTSTGLYGTVSVTHGAIVGCEIYNVSGRGVQFGGSGLVHGNYIHSGPTNHFVECVFGNIPTTQCVVSNNIIELNAAGAWGLYVYRGNFSVYNNIFINKAAGTRACLDFSSGGANDGAMHIVLNNIIMGFSGAGGVGIKSTTRPIAMVGNNAFYNNTSDESYTGIGLDLGADVALAADPFTSAATGDFSLTAAAKTALGSLGWPSSYLGAHANTDPHITIGAIQLAATACDYPAEADVEFGVDYGSSAYTGAFVVPAEADVQSGVDYGAAAEFTGTFTEPGIGNVESGVTYGGGGTEFTGTFGVPAVADVQSAVQYGASGTEFTGTFTEPGVGNVEAGVTYGGGGIEFTGTFAVPAVADVRDGETYGDTAEFTGALDLPAVADVQQGVTFDGLTKTGTFVSPNVGDVEAGVTYGAAAEYTGTFAVPLEADVELAVKYGAGGTEFTGTLVVSGSTYTLDEMADAVWDEARAGHITDGTYGDTAEWAGNVDETSIAAAVWDRLTSALTTAGSIGKLLAQKLALITTNSVTVATPTTTSNTLNVSLYAGETRTLEITLTDANGDPISLTGATIEYHAALPTPVTKTVGSGITVTDAAAGEFSIALTQANTVGYERNTTADHECKVLTSGGEVITAFRGRLTILDSLIDTLPPA